MQDKNFSTMAGQKFAPAVLQKKSFLYFLQCCRSSFGPIVVSPVAETIVKGIVSRDENFFKAYSNI
jgi:hypothetical protein